MAAHTLRPTSSGSEHQQQHHGDFVLFGEDPIYATTYRTPSFSHPGSNLFPQVLSDVSFPGVLGESHISDARNMNTHFYSLGTSGIEHELPVTSSAPGFDHHMAYSHFGASDIPRSTYMTESLTSAPDVLIHPPTLSYHANQFPHPSEYRTTPSASPATSAGGFDGSGSGLSGSEAGSVRGSPFNPPVGVEDHLRSFGVVDPAFTDIDPSLVSNSPPAEQPLSAVSPYGSPTWGTMHSGPPSPNLRRQHSQTGRLTPGHQAYTRHIPYSPRRPSTGSVHSHRSMGSPHVNNLEQEETYIPSGMGYPPSRSPSQKSNCSHRHARAESTSESINSATGSAGGNPPTKDAKETLCLECNKCFRDLRAHQYTHLAERPEKCPIATCEYSKKGFARKYDCQRHTLTHYKGTMVCGFCPGSGSAMEKSFNRADVFKRHLMAVHHVEQTPPNGRQKKSSKGKGLQEDDLSNHFSSGKCSTCSITFATAQQFYEHLDDCVLSKVVEEEPAAAANEMNLSQIKLEDLEEDFAHINDDDEDDDEELGDVDEMDDDEDKDETYVGGPVKKNNKNRRAPTTRSKAKTIKRSGSGSSRLGDRNAITKPLRRRKKKKHFPAGWGASPEHMVTKRRCLVVYDGPKMLCKDEMMMSTEWEVRAEVGDLSDLDYWTLRRAEAFLDSAPSRGGEATPLIGGVR
ncbi:hypothetical protein BZA05DRAFT_441568 [Tricharina praecox]|uniref:uncharacterized protein n=1 Tax=Tricharina praecox TaxID=43433 RepID=UPI00221EDDCF|nr:uncharacterized protein BZA05DRAFT_441568 [Tricharina praecox]KAI5856931.1 hypothetical protein BZA05DRAFT_441568 [Tricharina praecox]